MNRLVLTVVVMLALAAPLFGCAYKAYEGPTLPESQVAVLSVACCLAGHRHFCIKQIDGKPIEQPCFIAGHMWYKFDLPPGEHTVSVEFTSGGQSFVWSNYFNVAADLLLSSPITHTERVLTFEAEAGHTYDIGPFWIKDTTTSEVVAGEGLGAFVEAHKVLARAEQGDAEAQFQLGHSQFRIKNPSQRRKWLCLAANQGHKNAQITLGVRKEFGFEPYERDHAGAYVWYSLAMAQGNDWATENRARVANKMSPAQIAEAEKLAAEWKPRDCEA